MSKKSPSLLDVAALAGVSAGTVSRALSRPTMISDTTREKVFAAVRQLRYVPNGAARALVMRRNHTVGAVVPRFGSSSFSTLVQALENTLADEGYTLLLSAPDHQRAIQTPAAVASLLERGIDALAILGYEQYPEVFTSLQAQGLPFVRLWVTPDSPWPAVGFDEYHAADQLIQHLADLGHRQIAFIGGRSRHNERARQRREGISMALSRHGMLLSPEATIETDYGLKEGFQATQALLQRQLPFSAIVYGNDYLAAGALSALHAAGINVPGQLSVASFNDNDFSAYLHPPLTTVRLPIEAMGKGAAHYLLAQLRGESPPPPRPLATTLIRRESTAAASGPPR